MFHFSDYFTESKHYNDSKKLVVGKMKNETGSVAIKNLLKWSQRCIHSW